MLQTRQIGNTKIKCNLNYKTVYAFAFLLDCFLEYKKRPGYVIIYGKRRIYTQIFIQSCPEKSYSKEKELFRESGPLDKGGVSTSVFGQNCNRPAAGNFFLTGHLSFLLSENAYAEWKWKYVVMH